MLTQRYWSWALTVAVAVSHVAVPISAHAKKPLGADPTNWPETDATCARLAGLLTQADVEAVIKRKGVKFAPVEADSSESCKLDISVPNAKVVRGLASISIQLKQYVSVAEAQKNVDIGIGLAGGPAKVKDIARTERGAMFQFTYGFEYALGSVDAAEFSINVRDTSTDGKATAAAIGQIVFRNALGSGATAEANGWVAEVFGFSTLQPILALAARCSKDDIPNRGDVQRAVEASGLSKVLIKPVNAMAPYAQRWIASNRLEEMIAPTVGKIGTMSAEQVIPECAKMAQELVSVINKVPAEVLKAHAKP